MNVVFGYLFTNTNNNHCGLKLNNGKTIDNFVDDDLYDYIKPFYESLNKHKDVNVVIIYDKLPQSFITKYQNEHIKFETVDTEKRYNYHVFDYRYFLLRSYLVNHTEIKRFWSSDINDVAWIDHPFTWWETLRLPDDLILAGEEYGLFNNVWFQDQLAYLPAKYTELVNQKMNNINPLNAGCWGANRFIGIEFLDKMMIELNLCYENNNTNPAVWDMTVFNSVLFNNYRKRVASFKMDYGLADTVVGGVKLWGYGGPLQHDRKKSLELLNDNGNAQLYPRK